MSSRGETSQNGSLFGHSCSAPSKDAVLCCASFEQPFEQAVEQPSEQAGKEAGEQSPGQSMSQGCFKTVALVSSAAETKQCAALLGKLLQSGDVIALEGGLGAGKTHFAQGLAQGLGIASTVSSPTFNLVVEYPNERPDGLSLYHFDLYRLQSQEELDNIGFSDYEALPGAMCIEWASKFQVCMPEDRLEIMLEVPSGRVSGESLSASSRQRYIKARATGQRSRSLLAGWEHALRVSQGAAEPARAIEAATQAASAEPVALVTASAFVSDGEINPKANSHAHALSSGLLSSDDELVIAFDTANEIIALGVGRLNRVSQHIEVLASYEVGAFRASNEKLLPELDALLHRLGAARSQIACVVCGRGPGSFTGVRICLASAKGLALGLNVPLFGVSTADAQAWQAWLSGIRGSLLVLGDAMRKEVYPVRYELSDEGPWRQNADTVIKAENLSQWLASQKHREATSFSEDGTNASEASNLLITGDALNKYAELAQSLGNISSPDAWFPTGRGLLRAAEQLWYEGCFDPDNVPLGNPYTLLPVYTRLSDAEEHERQRFAQQSGTDANASQDKGIQQEKNLTTGVQGALPTEWLTEQTQAQAQSQTAPTQDKEFLCYQPLEQAWVPDVAALEAQVMGSDAWNAAQIEDELPRADRTWWAAYKVENPLQRSVNKQHDVLVGYAGGWVVDGQVQILKVACSPQYRRLGIAQELLVCVARDARDLGATEMTLEVRVSNTGAQAFYEHLGLMNQGRRPHYYSDKEDAFIFTGPLPMTQHDVAGMELRINEASLYDQNRAGKTQEAAENQPFDQLILAVETSCDETAVALVNGAGEILSDVVASQIDFHARFGGVVPEIASRKHIEAIAAVAKECLNQANVRLGMALTWNNLSAVAVTYAPGLVGALVVGMAFAKGLAWAVDVPLIRVNHLEGHLYANKLARSDLRPPMVVSLVSGGHTMLVHVKDWGSYETLGTTLDDAVGEAFDKVAKAMGLGYPGGPIISRLAQKGNPQAVKFPRALIHSGDFRFSLSGLKTSVMTYIQKEKAADRELNLCDIAASFQAAVVDVQVSKARSALEQTGAKEFCLGGGVAANPALRAGYEVMCAEMDVRLTMPPLSACTDNAAMIALVALDRFREHKFCSLSADVQAHANLDEPY